MSMYRYTYYIGCNHSPFLIDFSSLVQLNLIFKVFQPTNGSLSSAKKNNSCQKNYNTPRIKEGMKKDGTATRVLDYNEED